MIWVFLTEQASVAEFNETGDETRKRFWKTYHPEGLQLNEIQSNHPQVTSYEFYKTDQWTDYESLVIWLH